jgi:hypothetical protein
MSYFLHSVYWICSLCSRRANCSILKAERGTIIVGAEFHWLNSQLGCIRLGAANVPPHPCRLSESKSGLQAY